MSTETGLIWLTSFPKSGSTWTLIFLNRLLFRESHQLDLKRIHHGDQSSSREWISDALGIEINELNHDEIDLLRPIAYQQLAQQQSARRNKGSQAPFNIHKVHDAYSYLPRGNALFPASATRCAVILVRNPLDIAVSFANHSNYTIEQSVDQLCRHQHALCSNQDRLPAQLRQLLWTWSEHVASWLDADIPKIVIRYEDLIEDSTKHFTRLCKFLALDVTSDEIGAAIKASEFKKLKELEREHGFAEKLPNVQHFFNKGIVGDWQNHLNEGQVEKIIQYNETSMRRLGYLNEANQPLLHPQSLEQCAL